MLAINKLSVCRIVLSMVATTSAVNMEQQIFDDGTRIEYSATGEQRVHGPERQRARQEGSQVFDDGTRIDTAHRRSGSLHGTSGKRVHQSQRTPVFPVRDLPSGPTPTLGPCHSAAAPEPPSFLRTSSSSQPARRLAQCRSEWARAL